MYSLYQSDRCLVCEGICIVQAVAGILLLEVCSNIALLSKALWFILRQWQHNATYITDTAPLVACQVWLCPE